jgi:NAD-dependent DNA ligase
MPKSIKGHVFAFTGKIVDWPRDSRLYPYVRRHGGCIANKAASMTSAEYLVHGEILGGRESTRKLEKAHELNIPIITEEMFLRLVGRN